MLFLISLPFKITLAMALTVFVTAFLASMLLTPLVRRLAPLIGLVDRPAAHKSHKQVTPLGGGIAIFSSVLLGVGLGLEMVHLLRLQLINTTLEQFALTQDLLLILTGGAVIFGLGLLDDYRGLSPWTRIAVETLVALGLFWGDIRVTFFIDNTIISALMTVFWILLVTNAFNLLDNMDGLAAGVAFITGGMLCLVAAETGQWVSAFLLLALLGAILGFLHYNFPPASIFMGDSGSLFLGYMLAALTIHFTFYQRPYPLFSVILPVLVFAVPLFDTATVVLIRRREGRPVFQGDQRHFSHRLVALGMNKTAAVLVIYLITFATGISATLLYRVDLTGALIIILQISGVLLVIHILENVSGRRPHA